MISESMLMVTYLGSAILFILALGGLSSNESARRGNLYGMLGMLLAIVITILAFVEANQGILLAVMVVGAAVGFILARKVKMTQMPELVALLHSMVGLAAVIIGYVSYMDATQVYVGAEKVIHEIEIYIGIYIGGLTFTGSVIAYGKLSALISGKPILLPGRHLLNLILLIAVIVLGVQFVQADSMSDGFTPLYLMTAIAFIFGIHMVIAIGGADMPVVISMLNSYSGWAAAATGFMLSNDLLIVTGALVGSSGAILSYIMCKAMNRNFFSVISGGFGTPKITVSTSSGNVDQGDVIEINIADTADLLMNAKKVMIVPGYGMAMAQAQHAVSAISRSLMGKGVNVRFGIHPVAGRMPGHMNVLLAEAKVPYDVVFEMDEINEDFPNVDVTIVIGANDTVNPSAEEPGSPISGMPVMEVWNSKTCIVLKRGMAAGYSGIDNPLFFKDNTRMLFGDAKTSMDALEQQLQANL